MRVCLAALWLWCAACAGGAEPVPRRAEALRITGSDTMAPLIQRWADAFSRRHAGAAFEISGGGTGIGIAALVHRSADIATASRRMRAEERAWIEQIRRVAPVETQVAVDVVTVFVHPTNPVRALRLRDLRKVYRGEIRRWSELGGPPCAITLYGRDSGSGTYAFFKTKVLEELDFIPETQLLPASASVIEAVRRDRCGIGYSGAARQGHVRTLALIDDAHANSAIEITRYLYFYTAGAPSPAARDFIAFARSPEGQALTESVSLRPLTAPSAGTP